MLLQKKFIPSHYPEQKNWIWCLLFWVGNSNFLLRIVIWNFCWRCKNPPASSELKRGHWELSMSTVKATFNWYNETDTWKMIKRIFLFKSQNKREKSYCRFSFYFVVSTYLEFFWSRIIFSTSFSFRFYCKANDKK